MSHRSSNLYSSENSLMLTVPKYHIYIRIQQCLNGSVCFPVGRLGLLKAKRLHWATVIILSRVKIKFYCSKERYKIDNRIKCVCIWF